MKTVLLLLVLVALAAARPEEYYSTKYDDFDVEELVQNLRLLKSYGKCFLDKGPCTAEGSDFKKVIPDALRSKCSKCSPKQRKLIRTVIVAFQEKLPDMWKELSKKEDPKEEYKAALDEFLSGTD